MGPARPLGRRTIGARVRGRKSNDFLPAAGGKKIVEDSHFMGLYDFERYRTSGRGAPGATEVKRKRLRGGDGAMAHGGVVAAHDARPPKYAKDEYPLNEP